MMRDIRFPDYEVPGVQHHQFNPYENNGGSIAAIAGDDFAVIAADTRLSSGYIIHSRNQEKLFKLSNKTVLATAGCWPDSLAFLSTLRFRMQHYEHVHNKSMSTDAVAQMTSILMYNKRFFPYYVSNVLAGIDSQGKGCVYSYDPVGHCERATHRAAGSSGPLLQPLLDNQVDLKNQQYIGEKPNISKDAAIELLKDLFISAAERDIYTGDQVQIAVITAAGVEYVEPIINLRRD